MSRAGEVWVAEIPFTGGHAAKLRPVLVLWEEGLDVVVAAITSAAPRSPADVPLVRWAGAGLRVPSTVRLSRLDCLERPLLRRRLGRLATEDAATIRETWNARVGPQF
jgi:mRNA interferase MazF